MLGCELIQLDEVVVENLDLDIVTVHTLEQPSGTVRRRVPVGRIRLQPAEQLSCAAPGFGSASTMSSRRSSTEPSCSSVGSSDLDPADRWTAAGDW